MSAENFGLKAYKCQFQRVSGTASSATGQIGSGRVILHGLIVNSHTSGIFQLANGTSTSFTVAGGSYTLPSGSSPIMLEPVDFTSGLFMMVSGTLDATVLYNTLP